MGLHRINVGSGQRKFGAGWINVDIHDRWEPDLICDMSSLPYPDSSCSMIVAHHTLEHVELTRADSMLREWHRLLAPGGSLLIFVPDLHALALAWLDGRINDFIYGVNLYGAFMGHDADTHKWGYSKQSLERKLRTAALWREVKTFDWRGIEGADIACDWWILALEVIK